PRACFSTSRMITWSLHFSFISLSWHLVRAHLGETDALAVGRARLQVSVRALSRLYAGTRRRSGPGAPCRRRSAARPRRPARAAGHPAPRPRTGTSGSARAPCRRRDRKSDRPPPRPHRRPNSASWTNLLGLLDRL